jgi:hypothetical protein
LAGRLEEGAGQSRLWRPACRAAWRGHSAYCLSGFREATILVVDGAGNYGDTETWYAATMSWAVAVCVDFSELVICNCLFTYWFFVRLRARRR